MYALEFSSYSYSVVNWLQIFPYLFYEAFYLT